MPPLPDTAYVLVGRCLAPRLTAIQREDLACDLARPGIRWEVLLAEANRQHATPLWYSRLRAHGLLAHLPSDLGEYLAQLHAANRARNRMLRDELAMILDRFHDHGIPVILLKGAATFADGLYTDPGARLMSDMDLLVPGNRIREAERLLMMEGYVDDPQDRRHLDVWPGRTRHSHIATLLHMQRRVAVELHYNVAYGQAGRIVTAAAAWSAAVDGTFRGRAVSLPAPHHRLLHNALHATLPHREFAQARVRLSDLAECAALVDRYPGETAPERWLPVVRRHDLGTALGAYLLLARLLMRADIRFPAFPETTWHRERLLSGSPPAAEPDGGFGKLGPAAWRAASFVYDLAHLPAWVWRNVCYGDDDTPATARLGCVAKLLLKPGMLQNVFGKAQ